MTWYTDTSGDNTPLKDAIKRGWFDHSFLIGDQRDPFERASFLSRFNIREEDLEKRQLLAERLRQASQTFQRFVIRGPEDNIQTPGVAEQLWEGPERKLLFFPASTVAPADRLRNLQISMLRIPSSTGQHGKTIATAPLPPKEEERGALYDIRLPASLASSQDPNRMLIRVPDGMEVPRSFHLLSLFEEKEAWCGLDPASFYHSLSLPLLSNNVQKTVSDPTFLFSSSILVALVQHQIVPFLDSDEVNAHHAFLGRMQQADIGLEQCLVVLRNSRSLRPLEDVQQAMNVLLLRLLPLEAIRVEQWMTDLIAVFQKYQWKDLEFKTVEKVGELSKTTVIEESTTVLKLLLQAERHAPGWRIYASRLLEVEVNTPFCVHVFLLLLLQSTTFPTWNGPFLQEREEALQQCVEDERRQLTLLLDRYDVNEGEGYAARAALLGNWRKIVSGAFLDMGRLLYQQQRLRSYQSFFDWVMGMGGAALSRSLIMDQAMAILAEEENIAIPSSLFAYQYQWEGERVEESPIFWTESMVAFLLNISIS